MKFNAKKTFTWILIIFVVYAIYTSPTESAGAVKLIWDVIAQALEAVGTFVSSIIRS